MLPRSSRQFTLAVNAWGATQLILSINDTARESLGQKGVDLQADMNQRTLTLAATTLDLTSRSLVDCSSDVVEEDHRLLRTGLGSGTYRDADRVETQVVASRLASREYFLKLQPLC